MKKSTQLALAALVLSVTSANNTQQLKFRPDGTFKFVQFTDIHFAEGFDTDSSNIACMKTVLDHEKPDMVVVTGDVISGYAWDGKEEGWYAKHYQNFTKVMYEYNMPWALTAGNHDTQGDLTREQVSELDRTYNLSMTQPNGGDISHAFNYWLPIYH